jgi:CheY-like chemotaxis protein
MTKTRSNFKPGSLVVILIVAGLYFLAARRGLSLALLNASVSPVWPPMELRNIPAVALTVFAAEKDAQLALAAGFQIHLAKPVEPDRLVQVIEDLTNGKRAAVKS